MNEITELVSARCALIYHPYDKGYLTEHTRCARMRNLWDKEYLIEHTRCVRMRNP